MDLNARTVWRRDLREPGALQTEYPSPGGGAGSSLGWNYVEWDGRDTAGDRVGNGVYLYELQVQSASGKALRKRDKVVFMCCPKRPERQK
jgi:hypothetical protein